MVAALRHRGPDGMRVKEFEGCALGHARLSVIDLVCGTQPMSDPTGRYWIILNGELYNYRELRAELAALGRVFVTQSDTEVLLAAYLEWDHACLDRFRGMFAFAIWDADARVLFAARDLCGEKPLFFTHGSDGSLALASVLGALEASGMLDRQLDLSAVDAFLALGYVPPDRTILSRARPLPPAHYLTWSRGVVSVRRYWKAEWCPRAMSLTNAADQLRDLLARAVRRQTVADVPVGAFLSGGLDSSTVVALMHEAGTAPVRTFSVGFGKYIDELPYARAVAERYGTEHHELDFGEPDVGALLQRMAGVYDEPFADSSHIPTFLLSEFARRHVTVALTGDGGDELFGGYARYLPLARSEDMSASLAQWAVLRMASRMMRERLPALHMRSVAAGLAARWPDMWTRAWRAQVQIADRTRRVYWGTRAGRIPPLLGDAALCPPPTVGGMNRAFDFDASTYLPGDILVKVDRASMAHGLETRAPFLDRDVLEFALTIPPDLKVRGQSTKIVLHEACSRYWPPALRTRGKRGFGAPYPQWMARPDVRVHLERVFAPHSVLRGVLDGLPPGTPVARDYSTWILMTLGLWLERHDYAA